MLACGLENGAIWILHHVTLDPLEKIPYKHSSAAVNKIAFAQRADYMAYTVRKNSSIVPRMYNLFLKDINIRILFSGRRADSSSIQEKRYHRFEGAQRVEFTRKISLALSTHQRYTFRPGYIGFRCVPIFFTGRGSRAHRIWSRTQRAVSNARTSNIAHR